RPLVAIQAQIVGALLFPPEALVEIFVEAGGSLAQFGRPSGIAPDLIGLRHTEQCVKGVALELAERNRERGDGAVLVLNGIVRVFPALVVEADRRAGLVFLEPVAIAISVLEHPLKRSLGVRP